MSDHAGSVQPASGTIHLENQGVAVCRGGNAKFNMKGMRRSTDIRRVNCLLCLRTALIRARKCLEAPASIDMMETPEEVPFADTPPGDFDHEVETLREIDHSMQLETWLRGRGWDGPRTGQVIRRTVSDGQAVYMYGDGPQPCLVHLPYGDAYRYPDIRYLPIAEIERLLERQLRYDALFGTPSRPHRPSKIEQE